ncbi:MAG TPA: putative molybdenum carrier protein [Aeromicrobium sp.]|nr:putative molybdenum carrier protein [Aeromicrobium sp.]
MTVNVTRIVSGGQTGADRAALDVAIELGITYGGWCPAGGWADDYPQPPGLLAFYPKLTATAEPEPAVRTRLNVRDSDATLIVWDGRTPSPGTELTMEVAQELGRPTLVTSGDAAETRIWLTALGSGVVLNVAGPRESTSPGSYATTVELLLAVLA